MHCTKKKQRVQRKGARQSKNAVVDVYGNTSQRLQQSGKSALIQPCDGVHGTCIVIFVNSLSVATLPLRSRLSSLVQAMFQCSSVEAPASSQ